MVLPDAELFQSSSGPKPRPLTSATVGKVHDRRAGAESGVVGVLGDSSRDEQGEGVSSTGGLAKRRDRCIEVPRSRTAVSSACYGMTQDSPGEAGRSSSIGMAERRGRAQLTLDRSPNCTVRLFVLVHSGESSTRGDARSISSTSGIVG